MASSPSVSNLSSLIKPFIDILNVYFVPGSVLGIENTVTSQAHNIPALLEMMLSFLVLHYAEWFAIIQTRWNFFCFFMIFLMLILAIWSVSSFNTQFKLPHPIENVPFSFLLYCHMYFLYFHTCPSFIYSYKHVKTRLTYFSYVSASKRKKIILHSLFSICVFYGILHGTLQKVVISQMFINNMIPWTNEEVERYDLCQISYLPYPYLLKWFALRT